MTLLSLGRILMLIGVVIFLAGALFYFLPRLGLPLGRLPGDLRFRIENITCFFPLATSIFLSVLLTLALTVIARFLNR